MGMGLAQRLVLPFLLLVHLTSWHTCKYHNVDGMCVQMFGTWEDTAGSSEDVTPAKGNRPLSFFKRLGRGKRKKKELELEMLEEEEKEKRQKTQLTFVREMNLFLALLCLFATFLPTESSSLQIQTILFVEAMTFTWSGLEYLLYFFQNGSEASFASLLLSIGLLGLGGFAVIGLLLQFAEKLESFPRFSEQLKKARLVGATTQSK